MRRCFIGACVFILADLQLGLAEPVRVEGEGEGERERGGERLRSNINRVQQPEASVSLDKASQVAPLSQRRRIGLARAVKEALQQNIGLALARAEQELAAARRGESVGALVPELRFSVGGAGRRGIHQGSLGVVVEELNFGRLDPGGSVSYSRNPVAEALNWRAKADVYTAKELTHLSERQQLLFRVGQLYQELVLAKIGVQISQALVEDSRQLVKISEARAVSGVAAGSAVERAKAKVSVDEQRRIHARELWYQASTRLALVIRAPPNILLEPLEQQLTMLAWESAAGQGSPNGNSLNKGALGKSSLRPDVRAVKREVQAQGKALSAAWWNLLGPRLMLEVRQTLLRAFSKDLATEQGWRTDYAGYLMWRFSWQGIKRIAAQRQQRAITRLKAEDLEQQARGEVALAKRALRAAVEQIPMAQRGHQASQENLKISMAKFRAGTAIALEIFDAQDTVAEARLNLARAIVNFNVAQLRLLAATGAIRAELFL